MIRGIKHASIKQPILCAIIAPFIPLGQSLNFSEAFYSTVGVETVTKGRKGFFLFSCTANPLLTESVASSVQGRQPTELFSGAAIKRQDKGRHAMAAPIFPSLFVF